MKKLFSVLFVVLFTMSVNAQPIQLSIYADNYNIPFGGSTVIYWNSLNATRLVAKGGTNGWAGTKNISGSFNTEALNQSTLYELVGYKGTDSSTVGIFINLQDVYMNGRTVGSNTIIEVNIYANGNISLKGFDFIVERNNDLDPRNFSLGGIFWQNGWDYSSNLGEKSLNVAALSNGKVLNLKYGDKIGTLRLKVGSNHGYSPALKISFFDGKNESFAYAYFNILEINKSEYGDLRFDGKFNISDALGMLSLFGAINLDDRIKIISDLSGDGEINSQDGKIILEKIVNPEYYEFPIWEDYNVTPMGRIAPLEPVNANWIKMANGKYGLFASEKITNGDLITKNTTTKITGSSLFTQVNEKIYFMNQNSSANNPIITANSPVQISGTVNEGRTILVSSTVTAVEENTSVPTEFSLAQNYPNPFNPTTMISYSIPNSGIVTLKVYDILGKEVAELVNEQKAAGNYSVKFDASKLSSGMYMYKITCGNLAQVKKMLLMK